MGFNEKGGGECSWGFRTEREIASFFFFFYFKHIIDDGWYVFEAVSSYLPLGPAAQEVADTFAISSLFSPVTKTHRQLCMSANQIRDSL